MTVPRPSEEDRGTVDRALRSLLESAMAAGMRLVVSGETGAGKTTLVRAMTNVLSVDTGAADDDPPPLTHANSFHVNAQRASPTNANAQPAY